MEKEEAGRKKCQKRRAVISVSTILREKISEQGTQSHERVGVVSGVSVITLDSLGGEGVNAGEKKGGHKRRKMDLLTGGDVENLSATIECKEIPKLSMKRRLHTENLLREGVRRR